MSRHIAWNSGVFKEIERVYQRAEQCESIAPNPLKIMEHLELQALDEVKRNIALIRDQDGKPLSPERYGDFSENAKEKAISLFSEESFATSWYTDHEKIVVKLSPFFPKVIACTFFYILDHLERMESLMNGSAPKRYVLELQGLPDGRKELEPYEFLLMHLYPWIFVREFFKVEEADAVRSSEKAAAAEEEKEDVVFYAFEDFFERS